MTIADPFASAPVEEAPAEEPKTVGTVKVAVKPDFQGFAGNEIVTTFKAGTGYDQPWVVIHASSVEESAALLDQSFADYLGQVKKVAAFFNSGSNANVNVNTARPVQQGQPQGSVEPPSWFPPAPAPGWVYKTGFKKDGSGAWHAWAPARKGEGDWQFHNPPK